MAPDHLQDIVDTNTGDIVGLRKVAKGHRGEIDRYAGAGKLLIGNDAVQRPFELAAAAGYLIGDEFENIAADNEIGIALPSGLEPRFEDMIAQIKVGNFDVHHQAASQP